MFIGDQFCQLDASSNMLFQILQMIQPKHSATKSRNPDYAAALLQYSRRVAKETYGMPSAALCSSRSCAARAQPCMT